MTTDEEKTGKILAVCSAKGGIGRTLIAINLAIALNKKNLNVHLLDANLQFGDISTALDMQPTFTLKDVVEELSSISPTTIQNYLSIHSTGIHVLPAPEKPEYAELISSPAMIHILELIREQSDYLVVDTNVGIEEQTVDILEKADQILMVTSLEMTALRNTKRMLETLEKLGLQQKIVLIVNRHDMDSLMKAEDVPEMLGIQETFFIPNNFKLSSQSLNIGVPFVVSQTKSYLSKAFFKMAESLLAKHPVGLNHKNKESFVSKLLSKH